MRNLDGLKKQSIKSKNYSEFLETYRKIINTINVNSSQSFLSQNSLNSILFNNFLSFIIISKETNKIYLQVDLTEKKIFQESKFIKLILNVINKLKKNEKNMKKINFEKIINKNNIIEILQIEKINFYFIGIFLNNPYNQITKILLLHLVISYYNLKKVVKIKEKLFKDIFKELFLIPLIKNFEFLYLKISKRKNIILSNNIEYQTSLLLELSSNKILFDIFNSSKKNLFQSISKNNKLWEEILYHCHQLKQNYEKENFFISNEENLKNYLIKLECRATYPRKIFLIKFIPILKGCCLIHIYNQYKLSKIQTNYNNYHIINDYSNVNGYKEFEITNGFDNIISDNEIKFFEILETKNIEIFLREYFTFSKDFKNDMYYFLSNKQIKYLNEEILNIINNNINEEKFIESLEIIKKNFQILYKDNNNISDNKDEFIMDKKRYLSYITNLFEIRELDTSNSLSNNQIQIENNLENFDEVLERINNDNSRINNFINYDNNIKQKKDEISNHKNNSFNNYNNNSLNNEPFHLDITKISNSNIDISISLINNEFINNGNNKSFSNIDNVPCIKCDDDKINIDSIVQNN